MMKHGKARRGRVSCTWTIHVKLTKIDVRTWGGEDSEPDVELFLECGSGGLTKKKSRRGEERRGCCSQMAWEEGVLGGGWRSKRSGSRQGKLEHRPHLPAPGCL